MPGDTIEANDPAPRTGRWWRPDWIGVWASTVSALLVAVVVLVVRWWVDRAYARLGITAGDAGFSYLDLAQTCAIYVAFFGGLLAGVFGMIAWVRQANRNRGRPGPLGRVSERVNIWARSRERVPDGCFDDWLLVVFFGSLFALVFAVVGFIKLVRLVAGESASYVAFVVLVFAWGAGGLVRTGREMMATQWMRRTLAVVMLVSALTPIALISVRGAPSLRERAELAADPKNPSARSWWIGVGSGLPLPGDRWWLSGPGEPRRLVAVLRWDSWLEVVEPCAPLPYVKRRVLASAVTLEPVAPDAKVTDLCGG